MSTQLWEFTVKAGTFKCQGRYGNVTWFGPSLPLLTKCSQTKVPLGGPRKAPPFNGNEQLFADTNDYHIKWIFPKENNGELSSCFSCILQSKIKKCSKGSRRTFSQSKGVGGGGRGEGARRRTLLQGCPWGQQHARNVIPWTLTRKPWQ